MNLIYRRTVVKKVSIHRLDGVILRKSFRIVSSFSLEAADPVVVGKLGNVSDSVWVSYSIKYHLES